jgi:hypothetical protein
MKKLLSALLLLAPLLLAPLHAFAADATGVWKATFDTQVGQQNYTYTLMVDGSTVTGTISSANGEGPVVDGTTDGTTISFTENLKFQDMELAVKYTGTFVSDNEISFTRDVGGFANESLTATRSTE